MIIDLDQWLFFLLLSEHYNHLGKTLQKYVDSASHIQAKSIVQISYPNIFKCSHVESHVQPQLKATGLYVPRDMESVTPAESKARV